MGDACIRDCNGDDGSIGGRHEQYSQLSDIAM